MGCLTCHPLESGARGYEDVSADMKRMFEHSWNRVPDMNLTHGGTPYVPISKDYYFVAGGSEDGRAITSMGGRIEHEELARRIRADPNWNHRPVFLAACHAGRGLAPELSKDLGVPVIASPDFVRVSDSYWLRFPWSSSKIDTPGTYGKDSYGGTWYRFHP